MWGPDTSMYVEILSALSTLKNMNLLLKEAVCDF